MGIIITLSIVILFTTIAVINGFINGSNNAINR